MRLIGADKFLNELSNEMFVAELHGNEWNGQTVNNLLCMGSVKEILDNQPTVEPNQWIPCSERLPEDIDENLIECYLVTDGFLIWMAYYKSNIGWVFAECTNSDKIIDWTEITAWQPLPSVWKGENNG